VHEAERLDHTQVTQLNELMNIRACVVFYSEKSTFTLICIDHAVFRYTSS